MARKKNFKKIPFDIQFREQIESGQYRLIDDNGEPVRVVCWDRKFHDGELPIVAVVGEDERFLRIYSKHDYYQHLWIVVGEEEPELTPFEKALADIYSSYSPMLVEYSDSELALLAKKDAPKLLAAIGTEV